MSSASSVLSAVPPASAWASRPTSDYGGATAEVAILPIHALGDHGLGLPLDSEEVLGSMLLSEATRLAAAEAPFIILPPLRVGLSPYQESITRQDPDTLHAVLREIARGVQHSGYQKLVFWTTSPWNSELIDAASRDIRVALNLQTFVVELAGIGLSLHPASPDRAAAQSLVSTWCNQPPEEVQSGPAVDSNFRPGNWTQLPAIKHPTNESPADISGRCAARLARLLQEISDRPPLADSSSDIPLPAAPDSSPPAPEIPPSVYPHQRRARYLPALTPHQLKSLPGKADALVVIPVGAIEQHGAHLPVGVDSLIAEAAATGLAQRLPEHVWFAPTLAYGKSNEHLDFPGTLSLGERSLRRLVSRMVRQLHTAGFRQFALLNTHGGNSSVLTYTLRELQTELAIRAGILRLPSTDDLEPQEQTWGFHAGEWETSVMLAIAPETVRMEQAICHYPATLDDPGELRPENAPAIFSWMTRDIAPDGVMGDATKGTAVKGEKWLGEALDQLAARIRKLLQRESA